MSQDVRCIGGASGLSLKRAQPQERRCRPLGLAAGFLAENRKVQTSTMRGCISTERDRLTSRAIRLKEPKSLKWRETSRGSRFIRYFPNKTNALVA